GGDDIRAAIVKFFTESEVAHLRGVDQFGSAVVGRFTGQDGLDEGVVRTKLLDQIAQRVRELENFEIRINRRVGKKQLLEGLALGVGKFRQALGVGLRAFVARAEQAAREGEGGGIEAGTILKQTKARLEAG